MIVLKKDIVGKTTEQQHEYNETLKNYNNLCDLIIKQDDFGNSILKMPIKQE